MKVSLAEHFHSIQGEGYWVGTPMHFIRLAGCSVGKLLSRPHSGIPVLPTGRPAWQCQSWENNLFWCDTDFNKHEEVELSSLLDETWESHICFTGGEPLLHKPIIEESLPWATNSKIIHIETSGTIDYNFPVGSVWVVVSPKAGYSIDAIEAADELKLLVDPSTKDEFPEEFLDHNSVSLSPINPVEDQIGHESLARALELLRTHPNWRLSVQLHKYLGLR